MNERDTKELLRILKRIADALERISEVVTAEDDEGEDDGK